MTEDKDQTLPAAKRSKRQMGLRMALVLYVVAPLTIAMGIGGYFALQTWEQQAEERMQRDLEMVARAIRLPLSHAMERNREGGIEQALESALSTDSVYSAYAFDMRGREISSAGDLPSEPQEDKLTELASERKKTGEYGKISDRRVYSYFVPLSDSRNRATGVLQLTRREKDFRDDTKRVRRIAYGGYGIAVVVMIGMVLIGQYGAMGRHFRRLIEGMKRIAAGDTSHRISLSGPHEITSISATFNEMLDSIQAAEAEIRRNRQAQLDMEHRMRMQEKLAAVGQLAAGVAHELGTPLGTVSGTAQRALRHDTGNPSISKALEKIHHEVGRMEAIIRQLLDFSHSRPLQLRRVDFASVVSSTVASLADEAARTDVTIETTGEAETLMIQADPIALEQVLVNLIRNAIQSAPGVRVRLSWEVRGDELIFAVDDDGPGIDESIVSRLFEPFFTTKSVGAGTGLGLAVVHGIIRDHGGRVWAESSDSGGARFAFSLPFHSDSANDSSA